MSEHPIDASAPSSWLAPYAAGMVDADGCIGIGRTFRDGREKYTLRVDVSQSEKGLQALTQLRQTFGGAVYTQRRATETQLAQYQWMLTSSTAMTALRAWTPYLIVKQAQAVLGMQAWEAIVAAPKLGRVKWTPELCEQIRALKAEMSRLNRLGP